ncbi:TIGR04141 family sporadically distributed protein [Stenotrophomonas maltophilia]|nr:TIGR04141 family sporadically distributed protein [Stenotrophomonas maltophilia]
MEWHRYRERLQYTLLLLITKFRPYGRQKFDVRGGQSKFEFCDFLDIDKKILYFVKNPSSAAGMSHLYEQVRRTVELFFGSNEDYLGQLRHKFSEAHPAIDPSWLCSPPRSVEWEICMVSMGKPATHLSMFSKCGLMKLHREVSNRCRLVSFAQV